MAGGMGGKFDPKLQKLLKNGFGSEVLKDSQISDSAQKTEKPSIFSLKGVLNLGQTAEISKKADNLQKSGEKLFTGLNHLEHEQKVLFDQRQQLLEKNINELRAEIQQLIKATDHLEKQVETAVISPVVEFNDYQLKFLDRVRVFIANFRKNISEAGNWIEDFSKRKKKKNYFWSMAKDKKKGGDQYMFSEEHSVARSVN
jgi:uncharacterized protein YoxC